MMQQLIQWASLENNKEYEFELILPFRSEPKEFREGGYLLFIALNKDKQEIILDLPYKTFTNALFFLTVQQKKSITENTNLFVKIKRLSDRRMIFTEIYSMQPTPEHIEKANHFYSINNQDFGEE
jgi:hypothetical protein